MHASDELENEALNAIFAFVFCSIIPQGTHKCYFYIAHLFVFFIAFKYNVKYRKKDYKVYKL